MTSGMLSFVFSDSSRNTISEEDNQSVPGAYFGVTSLSPDSYFLSLLICLPQCGGRELPPISGGGNVFFQLFRE